MKSRLKINLLLSIIMSVFLLTSSLSISYGKEKKIDIESKVDAFFKIREDDNDSLIMMNRSKDASNQYDNIYEVLDKQIMIKDENLRDYLVKYIELNKMVRETSKIEEEILKNEFKKEITTQGNKIIVDVSNYKESIFTIDGQKSEDISSEQADYRFTFDKESGQLLEYIPYDVEEQVLMKSNMDEIIKKEYESRMDKKSEEYDMKNEGSDNNYITPYSYNEYGLNRSNMLNYAYRYVFNYNDSYGDFNYYGGDCANFISQIIKAGNAPFDTSGSYRWYYYNMNDRTHSWSGANELYTYLINNDYVGPQGYLANSNSILYNMELGDCVFIDFDYDGRMDHSTCITKYQSGNSEQTKITCHTKNRKDYPLSKYKGNKKYVRLTGYGKN